jgi:predicted HTH transcriptional regulator
MPIDRLDFDSISEADLIELLTTKVPEGLRIEYKQALYGNSDAEKREALKDTSAFANAFGGHLILGIEEQNGLPIAIHGISSINPDEVMLRLEQLVLSGIEPRIQGMRIRAISLANVTFHRI